MASLKSIAVCSISPETKLTKFIDFLEKQTKMSVTYLCIKGGEIDVKDSQQYECVILIHPIEAGRMSLTDVKDARYDYLLTQQVSSFGRNRIAVMITGVKRFEHLQTLKQRVLKEQKTLSLCSAYVTLCHTLEENGLDVIDKMLSGLSTSSKPMQIQSATTAESTYTSEEGTGKKQVSNIMLTPVSMPGTSVGLTDGRNIIDLVICADGSTSDTLLKTLDKESDDMMDFKVYKQVSDQWNYTWTRTSSNDLDQSHCAVFIYWTTAPTEFTQDDQTMFQRIITDHGRELKRKRTTQNVLKGKADTVFRSQLSECIDTPSPGLSIVTVTPGKPSKESSLLTHQREAEYDMEVKSKDEARQRIRILEGQAEDIKDQIRDLKKKEIKLDSTVKSLEDTVNLLEHTVEEKQETKMHIQKECDKMEEKLKDLKKKVKPAQKEPKSSRGIWPFTTKELPTHDKTGDEKMKNDLTKASHVFEQIAKIAGNANIELMYSQQIKNPTNKDDCRSQEMAWSEDNECDFHKQ